MHEYGFPTEPKIKINDTGGYTYVNASDVSDTLNNMAKAADDPWPYAANWKAIREAEALGYKFGPIARAWAEAGESWSAGVPT